MAGASPSDFRNLASSASARPDRQRSALAQLIAVADPGDADAIAAKLLGEFQSLARILAQNPKSTARIVGDGSPIPSLLRAAGAAAAEAARAKLEGTRLSPQSTNLAEYLKRSMGGLPIETLRVLFLDPMHRLIADEQMQAGTVDRLALYPRTLFQRAMELQAAALILVHNHPSGCADPSNSDIAVTHQLIGIGRTLDIDILGHVIVTASSHKVLLPDIKTASGSVGTFYLRSDGGLTRTGADGQAAERLSLALVNARRTMRRRILRDQLLDAPGLFGDPAWDMLLEVFVHQVDGRPISTSSLCIASGLSMTAALRVLPRMEEAGLVQREPDPGDGRRNFIVLTPAILQRLVAFFEEYGD